MSEHAPLIVILAAGKGTRMKSAIPKVLHKVAGRSMLGHAISLAQSVKNASIAVVIGPNMDAVRRQTQKLAPDAQTFVQENQLGTADAVLAARPVISRTNGAPVLVLYADTPLIKVETAHRLLNQLDSQPGVCVLGFDAKDPTGYGRLVTDADGTLTAIREHKDATPEEHAIRLCNSGVMGFKLPDLNAVLESIGNENAKGEYYLTDAVEVARANGLGASVVVGDEDEVLGINSRDQLANAEQIWQQRARAKFMTDGVTMIAPETCWLSFDTVIGRDVIIEPNVFFGPGVTLGDNVQIKANCHFEGSDAKSSNGVKIGSGSIIGPFARLRPGANLETNVHIGNFVEVKNGHMGDGAKANHLSYIGDAIVGTKSNIGAGTIFCNYDGFFKHTSELGKEVFIGSNSALVGPVKVGDGAYVAAGSVVSTDVSTGALAIERSQQIEHPQWAEKFRIMMRRRKQNSA